MSKLKIMLVSGSHRLPSQTGRVARYVQAQLDAHDEVESTYLLDLGETKLPMWDEGVWKGADPWPEVWGPHSEQVAAADAFVILSPEWAGMVTPAIKNFFLLCNSKIMGDKPAMIVSVSGSRNGAYPVAELRSSSYKNVHLNYIPHHIIVRDVQSMLEGDEPAGEADDYLRKRIAYASNMLIEYGKALRLVRESGKSDYDTYPFGV